MSSILHSQTYNANRYSRIHFLNGRYTREIELAALHHTRANHISEEITQIKKSLQGGN